MRSVLPEDHEGPRRKYLPEELAVNHIDLITSKKRCATLYGHPLPGCNVTKLEVSRYPAPRPWGHKTHRLPNEDCQNGPCLFRRRLALTCVASNGCSPYRRQPSRFWSAQCHAPHPRASPLLCRSPPLKTGFSTADLVRAYHRISMPSGEFMKTAIETSFGLFKFTRNCAQTVQGFIDSIQWDFCFVFVYIDDIFVASLNVKQLDRTYGLNVPYSPNTMAPSRSAKEKKEPPWSR